MTEQKDQIDDSEFLNLLPPDVTMKQVFPLAKMRQVKRNKLDKAVSRLFQEKIANKAS